MEICNEIWEMAERPKKVMQIHSADIVKGDLMTC